jgi:hypothetical protein
MTITGAASKARVPLVVDEHPQHTMRAQHHAPYLFYHPSTFDSTLSPSQFSLALAIRLRAIPQQFQVGPTMCACGNSISSNIEAVEHAITCPKFSGVAFVERHNEVLQAVCRCSNSYGVWTTAEPRCFEYDNGLDQRPDIIFHTPQAIVTDVSVTNSVDEHGSAAKDAAEKKMKTHAAAVQNKGMIFIPCAMEIWGHIDRSVVDLIEAIAKQLPTHLQWSFKLDMMHVISTSLAKSRVSAFTSALRSNRYREGGSII